MDKLKPGILNGSGLRTGGSRSSSAIGSKSKSGIVAKTGQDEPATQEHVQITPANSQTRPGVQMPGERTRKVSGEAKAGQNVAGEAEMVKVAFSSKSPGKQTWKGAAAGYTVREEPKYVPSPAADTWQDTKPFQVGMKPTREGDYTGKNVHLNGDIKRGGGSAKQSVKGKPDNRTGGEAKSVAGQYGVSKA